MRKVCFGRPRKGRAGAADPEGVSPARTYFIKVQGDLACVERGRPSVRCRGYKRIKRVLESTEPDCSCSDSDSTEC